jgi:hypothetical protein
MMTVSVVVVIKLEVVIDHSSLQQIYDRYVNQVEYSITTVVKDETDNIGRIAVSSI